MKPRYRIVTHSTRSEYFSAQVKFWWWPWWLELHHIWSDGHVSRFWSNTCGTKEEARTLIARHRAGTLVPTRAPRQRVVEYVDEEPE